jgi:hypothetical protein
MKQPLSVMFLSDAFTAEDIDYTIETYEQIAKGDN